MAASVGIKQYLNNHYDGMDPQQLILMLYNGALTRLEKTKEGIREKNIPKKGENLSKAIAIVSELNASLRSDMDDEATRFLRGLYLSILTELPKVSVSNDVEVVERSERYIKRLRDIWVTHVMKKGKSATPAPAAPAPGGYGAASGAPRKAYKVSA